MTKTVAAKNEFAPEEKFSFLPSRERWKRLRYVHGLGFSTGPQTSLMGNDTVGVVIFPEIQLGKAIKVNLKCGLVAKQTKKSPSEPTAREIHATTR